MAAVRLRRGRALSRLSTDSEAEPLSAPSEPASAITDSSRSPPSPAAPFAVAVGQRSANGRANPHRVSRPRSRTIASIFSSQTGPSTFRLRHATSLGTDNGDVAHHLSQYRTISRAQDAEYTPPDSNNHHSDSQSRIDIVSEREEAAPMPSPHARSPRIPSSALLSDPLSRGQSPHSLSRDRVNSFASNRSRSEASGQTPLSLVLPLQDSFSRSENPSHDSVAGQTARDRIVAREGRFDDDEDEHHASEVVEHLDVIDPGLSTVSHLANAANCILIPPIFASARRPVIELPSISLRDSQEQLLTINTGDLEGSTIPTGQSEEPLDELDLHVEHVLTKRQKARRALKGLLAFLKTPMGVFVAIYGFLVAFWGAAIVLFLLHWINLHNDYSQRLWVEITCQVETGLFTITGVGLIPWRVMDTYRIARIAHYKVLVRRLRTQRGLSRLTDDNDIPDSEADVLTEQQWNSLKHQQEMFMKSQTWYRPHETETHRAFSITTALWICLLIDGNSIFQCMLCGTMWGLNMYNRPAWTTGSLVPLSFLCGIAAAVLIWRGGEATKKVHQVEDKLRQALDLKTAEEGQGVPEAPRPTNQQHRLSRLQIQEKET